jgi:hypothetical protein
VRCYFVALEVYDQSRQVLDREYHSTTIDSLKETGCDEVWGVSTCEMKRTQYTLAGLPLCSQAFLFMSLLFRI